MSENKISHTVRVGTNSEAEKYLRNSDNIGETIEEAINAKIDSEKNPDNKSMHELKMELLRTQIDTMKAKSKSDEITATKKQKLLDKDVILRDKETRLKELESKHETLKMVDTAIKAHIRDYKAVKAHGEEYTNSRPLELKRFMNGDVKALE